MGGIAGIIHFRGDGPERRRLERLSEAISHRGPDDSGIFLEGPAGLVHRRLALSRAGGQQPVRDSRYVLVSDARVYDAGTLRVALDRQGAGPVPGGDAALLLAGWRAWGRDLLTRLEGDYAFAIWDTQEQVLHLARDPMGVRPLYTAWRDGRFAFCSDLRGLTELDWVSKEIARPQLAEYLAFRYAHAPRTLLRDVRQLAPGHLARVDGTGLRAGLVVQPSMAPPDAPEPSEDEVMHRLDTALSRAVERRLVSDEPVGVLLSGGTVSSAITGESTRRGALRTFNVSFADGGVDEASFAGRVARIHGAEHSLLRVTREDFVRGLNGTVDVMGQPAPSPAAVVQYLLFQHARSSVRVLLSGDGGDELMGGQRVERMMGELRVARAAERVPSALRTPVAGLLGHKGASLLGQDDYGLRRNIGASNVFGLEHRRELLRDAGLAHEGLRQELLGRLYSQVRTDPINAVLHAYQRGWLPEHSLLRSDRTSQAMGVEVRYPLLDGDVRAMLNALPGSAKIKRHWGQWHAKWPLKKLLDRDLPRRLVWRPKRRMPSPLNRWLRGEGEAFLWERVESVCDDPAGLFNDQVIRRMAREHAADDADHGARLWTLIFFDMWVRSL